MSEQQARPTQATLAGVLVIAGSVLLIAAAWERVSLLHTLEVRDGIETWLSRNRLEGMTVDGVTATLRVLCIVGAGAAAAAAVLGIQVFQRSRSARIALGVLAPFVLVGGMATNSLFGIVPVFGIAMLWMQPTRDWYAGRPWVQRHEERRAQRIATLRSGSPTLPGGPPAPPAPPSSDAAPAAPPAQPHPGQLPPPAPVPGFRQPTGRLVAVPRPRALVAACVLTWVMAALVAVGAALSAVAVAVAHEELFADLREQQPEAFESTGLTDAELVTGMTVLATGLVLWSVGALVLAGLAFAGQDWARIVLAVSGVCAGVLTVVMALSVPVLLVFALAVAAGTWLLLRPEVAHWYRLRRTAGVRR